MRLSSHKLLVVEAYLLQNQQITIQRYTIYKRQRHRHKKVQYNKEKERKEREWQPLITSEWREDGGLSQKSPIQRKRCTLCSYSDIQDEFHITLCCVKFKSLREKYIEPYYYRKPSMQKFVELMITDNRRELHHVFKVII